MTEEKGRRRKGEGSIYVTKDPRRGRADEPRWTVQLFANGKPVRRRLPVGASREDAERELAKMKKERDAGILGVKPVPVEIRQCGPTLGTILSAKNKRLSGDRTKAAQYERWALSKITDELAGLPLERITPAIAQSFFDNSLPLKQTSKVKVRAILVRMWDEQAMTGSRRLRDKGNPFRSVRISLPRPNRPGAGRATLYLMRDSAGALLYVGITASGADRWRQHQEDQDWWLEVATVTVHHFNSIEDARQAEGEAIFAWSPKYNRTTGVEAAVRALCDQPPAFVPRSEIMESSRFVIEGGLREASKPVPAAPGVGRSAKVTKLRTVTATVPLTGEKLKGSADFWPKPGPVTFEVFDVLGNLIHTGFTFSLSANSKGLKGYPWHRVAWRTGRPDEEKAS